MAKAWAKDFYNSMAWRTLRQQVLRRDRYTCAYCDGRAEEVHHKIELTQSNIYNKQVSLNPDNLISLCHDCHTKITLGRDDAGDGYGFDETGQIVEL